MKTKIFALMLMFVLAVSLVLADACTGSVCDGEDLDSSVVPLVNCEVELNGDWVLEDKTNRLSIDRGDEIEIKVRFTATADSDDVQIDAFMSGYDYDAIHDATDVFDITANTTYTKRLNLELPDDLDLDDDGEYKLRIMVSNRDGKTVVYDYNLRIETSSHLITIKDIVLDPENEIVSGRGLLASVRIKNMGAKDEDDGVKVTVSIPGLGLSASDYIDEVESDESVTSEDIYLRIPQCTPAGLYVVEATVIYDDGHEETTKTTSIEILEDETCDVISPDGEEEDKTVITVPGKQEVTQGASVVYPIMITNKGATSKRYTIGVSGADAWGTFRVDPSNVITVGAKETETVYLYLTAKEDAAAGEKMFVVDVVSDKDSEQIPMTAVVAESEAAPNDWSKIKQGLEIGLVVLIVLLVILGLIIGFSKLKGDDGDDDNEVSGQTYY